MKDTCQLHSEMKENITKVENKICSINEKSREDHKDMWDDIKNKVPMRLFMWIIGGLVLLYVAVSGAQTKITYDALQTLTITSSEVQKAQNIIKTDIEVIKKHYIKEGIND